MLGIDLQSWIYLFAGHPVNREKKVLQFQEILRNTFAVDCSFSNDLWDYSFSPYAKFSE